MMAFTYGSTRTVIRSFSFWTYCSQSAQTEQIYLTDPSKPGEASRAVSPIIFKLKLFFKILLLFVSKLKGSAPSDVRNFGRPGKRGTSNRLLSGVSSDFEIHTCPFWRSRTNIFRMSLSCFRIAFFHIDFHPVVDLCYVLGGIWFCHNDCVKSALFYREGHFRFIFYLSKRTSMTVGNLS